jgi:SWI/SNF-related matrix-associated actin-dependent regulator of chromatin subfamily A member 5
LDYSQKPTPSLLVEGLTKDMNEDYLKTVCVDQTIEDSIFSENSAILYFKNKNSASKALENLKSHGLKVKYCKKNDFLLQQIELEMEQEPSLRRRSKYLSEEKRFLPKEPKYNDFQFLNEARLIEIWKKGDEVTEDELEEKDKILSEGFTNWNKKDFTSFIKGLEKYGREHMDKIEIEGKTCEEIENYSKVFFEKMSALNDYDKISKKISKGEAMIERISLNNKLLEWKTQKYKNPWFEMTFNYGQIKGKQFTLEEDSFIVGMCAQFGYGSFDEIRQEIRKCWEFRFDWFFKSRTSLELQKRCDTLIKLIEKEHLDEVGGFPELKKKRKLEAVQSTSATPKSVKKKKKEE